MKQKCKTKALSKPATIKTFFSSMPQGNSQQVNDNNDDVTVVSASTIDSKENSCPSSIVQSVPSKSSKSKNSSVKSSSVKRSQTNATSCSSSRKRQKQGNIFNMMTDSKKGQGKSSDVKKEITCPICQTTFDSSIPYSEINKHIDNCLID